MSNTKDGLQTVITAEGQQSHEYQQFAGKAERAWWRLQVRIEVMQDG